MIYGCLQPRELWLIDLIMYMYTYVCHIYYAAQIAVEVSRLTELKRAQRHQPEVSQRCHNQHHSERDKDYELAAVKVSAVGLYKHVHVYTCVYKRIYMYCV